MIETAYQLAEEIARVARDPLPNEQPAEAVLRALHENGSWFCRVEEDDTGLTVEFPYEQRKLFP